MDLGEFHDVKPVIISAVIIMNITLNSIVIAVIAKYPQLREDRTTLFMFSLTISDFAAGCTCMPISVVLCSELTPHTRNMLRHLPKVQAVGMTWFAFISLHSLGWMTLFKMAAILKPFRCEQLLTRHRCYVIIAAVWITGALVAVVGTAFTMGWDLQKCTCIMPLNSEMAILYTIVVLVLCVALPVIAIIYATARILTATIRVNNQISQQVHSIGGVKVATGNVVCLTLQSIRSGKNILLMCLGEVALTTPLSAGISLRIVGLENQLPPWYGFVAFWIAMCHATFNCVLYLVLFRTVRMKAKQMFKQCC